MKKYKFIFSASIAFISIFIPCCVPYAYSPKKMVVVTVNTAAMDDLLGNSYLESLAGNGVTGLMSVRSNGKNNYYKSCLTIGSGERGEAYFNCLDSYKSEGSIMERYKNLTLNQCTKNNLVNLSINKLVEINSKTLYKAEPGKLGQILRSNGYKTSYIGGFWYENSIKSPAFFIAMDSLGLTDNGDIQGVFEGESIDERKLLSSFRHNLASSDFMVVEIGDIEKLYAQKSLYSRASYDANKNAAISRCGAIISSMVNEIDFSNTVLFIVSPYSGDLDDRTELLSPVIIYDGGKNKGILTSSTTKREGIVSSMDFAPYVLDYFGVEPEGFVGYPFKIIGLDGGIEYIKTINTRTIAISSSRSPVLKGYAVFIILSLIIYLIWQNSFSKFLLKLIMTAPFSFLVMGIFNPAGIFSIIAFIILFTMLTVLGLSLAFRKNSAFIMAAALINVLGLSFDIINRQYMLKTSIFSYDPVIGARFYGMGNEFLGVMVGCTLIFCGTLLEKKKKLKILIPAILLLVVLLTGLPQFGSNTGGLVTAASAFTVFMLLEYNLNIKHAVTISILMSILFLILLIAFNVLYKGSGSHLGRMIYMVENKGIIYGIDMLERKYSMAVRLIKYTIWSRVLIALIAVSVIIALKPGSFAKKIFQECSSMKNSYVGALTGSIVALMTNDSGIVTAAVIMLYAVSSAVLLSPLLNKR